MQRHQLWDLIVTGIQGGATTKSYDDMTLCFVSLSRTERRLKRLMYDGGWLVVTPEVEERAHRWVMGRLRSWVGSVRGSYDWVV